MDKIETYAVMKHLQKKIGIPLKEIHENMVHILYEDSPFDAAVKKWSAEFKLDRDSTEEDHQSGSSKVLTIYEQVGTTQLMVLDDKHLTVQQMANSIGISSGSVQTLLTEILGMSKLSARWIRVDISRILLNCYQANPKNFHRRLVTQDETWWDCNVRASLDQVHWC